MLSYWLWYSRLDTSIPVYANSSLVKITDFKASDKAITY